MSLFLIQVIIQCLGIVSRIPTTILSWIKCGGSLDICRLARSKEFTNVVFELDSHSIVQVVHSHQSVDSIGCYSPSWEQRVHKCSF